MAAGLVCAEGEEVMDAQERAHNLNPGKFCLWKQGSDFGHSKTCRNIAEQIRQAEQAAREDERRKVLMETEALAARFPCEDDTGVEIAARIRALKAKP